MVTEMNRRENIFLCQQQRASSAFALTRRLLPDKNRTGPAGSVGMASRPLLKAWRAIALLCVLVLVLPLVCRAQADTIYRENNAAVVVVVAVDGKGNPIGMGSGFLVTGNGAIVTNYHVISTAAAVKVRSGLKIIDVEGLLHVDTENDLAILKIGGTNHPKVRLGDARKLSVGEKLYAIGSPQGLENTISEGILSGLRKIDGARTLLQMTAPISPGSSGGPVFNSRGEVVGIATFLIADTQNLNFALPVYLIEAGLSKEILVEPQDACKVDFSETAACYFFQGLAYGTTGQLDRAANAFERSLTIDSKKTETYVNLAVLYARGGRYHEALSTFNEALKTDPRNSDALTKLGAVYIHLGQHDEATSVLKRALEVNPDDPVAHYTIAVNLGSQGQLSEAIDAVRESIRLQPRSADSHGYLATLYTDRKMYPEAAAAFKEAIRISPDDPRMHFGLGKIYAVTGDRVSALEEYKILRKLKSESADTLFSLIYK